MRDCFIYGNTSFTSLSWPHGADTIGSRYRLTPVDGMCSLRENSTDSLILKHFQRESYLNPNRRNENLHWSMRCVLDWRLPIRQHWLRAWPHYVQVLKKSLTMIEIHASIFPTIEISQQCKRFLYVVHFHGDQMEYFIDRIVSSNHTNRSRTNLFNDDNYMDLHTYVATTGAK